VAGRAQGFTLLELLVVLVIMGLTVGLVSAVVRPDDRALLGIEADRLAQLLDLAATEARLTGRSIGWTSDGRGYRFWRVSADGNWYEVRDSNTLRRRTLPRGMRISSLRVEMMPPQAGMRLQFGAYGPTPGFSIEMSLGDERYTVVGSPVGEVRVERGADNPDGRTALR